MDNPETATKPVVEYINYVNKGRLPNDRSKVTTLRPVIGLIGGFKPEKALTKFQSVEISTPDGGKTYLVNGHTLTANGTGGNNTDKPAQLFKGKGQGSELSESGEQATYSLELEVYPTRYDLKIKREAE